MRYLNIIFFLIYGPTFSQHIDLYTKFYDQKDALKKFKKELFVSDSTISKNTGDTLIAFFRTNVQSGFIKLNFLKSNDEFAYKYCIRQEVILDCSQCSKDFLKGLLAENTYGWRKVEENKYFTNYSLQTQLNVIYNDKEKYCMTLIFTYVDKPKKEYKDWYGKLSKIDN